MLMNMWRALLVCLVLPLLEVMGKGVMVIVVLPYRHVCMGDGYSSRA